MIAMPPRLTICNFGIGDTKVSHSVTTESGVEVSTSVNKGSSMSAFSDLRDAKTEHEGMRAHLSPDQNKEMDESFASGSRWLKVGYGALGLMVLALVALSFS
jgi:hypothetical protein